MGNRFSRTACTIALATLLTGFTADCEADVIGHWQLIAEKHAMHIEFKEDGTYVAQTALGEMLGHWELLGPAKIATWSSDEKPKRISEFAIVGEFLIIVGDQGTALRHKRVSPQNTD